MFTAYCPGHGATVLLGPDNIERLANRDDAIELHWQCWCGGRGVTVYDAPYECSSGARS